jgi:hypothetical protein
MNDRIPAGKAVCNVFLFCKIERLSFDQRGGIPAQETEETMGSPRREEAADWWAEMERRVAALESRMKEEREAAGKLAGTLADGLNPPKWALRTLAHLVSTSNLEDFAGDEGANHRAAELRGGLPFLVDYCLAEIDREVADFEAKVKGEGQA